VVEDFRERRIEELFRKFDYDYDGIIKVEDDG
jgi:Ca2+-binding EF-hand superfamily protein